MVRPHQKNRQRTNNEKSVRRKISKKEVDEEIRKTVEKGGGNLQEITPLT